MNTDNTERSSDEHTDAVFEERAEAAGNDSADSTPPESSDLQKQVDELQDRLLRTHADLENFRRRSAREAAEALKYRALPVVRDLLPGIDNLQRALTAAEQSGDAQSLIDGIRMVTQQFQESLKKQSVDAINPEGEAFDPNLHEALTQVPSADHEPMTVLQVVEPGYRIHDRVIRPAKVIVSCDPPEPADNSEPADRTVE